MRRCNILFLFCYLIPAFVTAQTGKVTISGLVKDSKTQQALPFVTVTVRQLNDSSFLSGTITNEQGRFSIQELASNEYLLTYSITGYKLKSEKLLAGRLSRYLDLGVVEMDTMGTMLGEVIITATQQSGLSDKMDKKTFSVTGNTSQSGGSVLQALKTLPGITISEDGKLQLRGSEKVTVLLDGKQTALSGIGNQGALDNIPASAIESVEIINNPSAKYDANGNAGIINIIYKKTKQEGLNGKLGLSTGLGAVWVKKQNLPTIRPQYQATPKLNPSLSLNYRKNDINAFFQGDYLYNKTLNKNDFTTRYYSRGDTIRNQVKRNRITTVGTGKAGIDWQMNDQNAFSVSGLISSEYVRDNGDIPYFNNKLTERSRLWQFYEDEVNSAATAMATFQHKFRQPGHVLNVGFNYTFHREDEKYFLTNILPGFTGRDTFMLIADEHVGDLNIDYLRPLKQGRFEGGFKLRRRTIPTNMQFFPGLQSPLDVNAAGWAKYAELIPALYGNYIYETVKLEVEAGLRMEYVKLKYTVNPDHNTYQSDGYSYAQPFPSLRLGYKLDGENKVSFFYNRRVDRPDEGDIRIFPKYDDPEILKVGNPALRPQFTNSFEVGYRKEARKGYYYTAVYFRTTNGTITRIGTIQPGSSIIYSVFQNAGRSYNGGVELLVQQQVSKVFSFNLNGNIYQNRINGFTVINKYPQPTASTAETQDNVSGNVKFNGLVHFTDKTELQVSAIYLAPDIIPQGKIYSRFALDAGVKKPVQDGKAEVFINASDILNTMRIRRIVTGNGFRFESTDYYETQVFRVGYSYKF